MTPEILITMANKVFARREIGSTKTWLLIWGPDGMKLIPARDAYKKEFAIVRISESDLQNGFTAKQWNHIGNCLFRFWKARKK